MLVYWRLLFDWNWLFSPDSRRLFIPDVNTGPATTKVIEGFLSEGLAEEQGWGWCEKLLKQRASHSSAAIESACEKALSILANPSYKAISTLIKNTAKSTELDDPAGGNPWAIRRY